MDAIYYRSPKRRYIKKILFISLSVIFLAALAYGGFFAWKFYSVGKKISMENNSQPSFLETVKSLATDSPVDIKSADPSRINILLLGIGGQENPAPNLTDTIIIMSINRQTDQVALLSIPRDLYVTIPEIGTEDKINTAYQYGLENSKRTGDDAMKPLLELIKNMTTLDVDYYAVLNFAGFRQIIDDIGGINIISDRDIYDASYPGPNYSYETFSLSKGFHQLDGATALEYARERHDDPEGDFGRAKRQQQIMQAAKNKIFSAATLFNPIALNNLLDTLGDNIKTNITPDEIGSFLELSKKLDTQNVINAALDAWTKDSLLKIVHIGIGGSQFSMLTPRAGNYSEIQDLAQNVFDLNKIKRVRDEIANENANIAIINESGNNQVLASVRKLLSVNLDYKNVTVISGSNNSSADSSMVYDLTGGTKPFTANELVTKLPAAISYSSNTPLPTNVTTGKYDVVVVLGKDLVPKYNMEEGTIQDLNNSRDEQEMRGLNKN